MALDLANSESYLKEQKDIEIPEEIKNLLEQRKQARLEKNWELSDKIRDELKEKGYRLKDTKEGMTVEKIERREMCIRDRWKKASSSIVYTN